MLPRRGPQVSRRNRWILRQKLLPSGKSQEKPKGK
jgi:hypothetical protein